MKSSVARLLMMWAALSAPSWGQTNSVASEWDISKTLDAIAGNADRLVPYVEPLHPEAWVKKGAPESYTAQWKQSVVQTKAVAQIARTLSKNPDGLSAELGLLFRMESLDRMLASLAEGIRRYQNPATADLLQDVMGQNTGHREKLQQYIADLANEKEQQFKVADSEAQRCRGFLSKQPNREKK